MPANRRFITSSGQIDDVAARRELQGSPVVDVALGLERLWRPFDRHERFLRPRANPRANRAQDAWGGKRPAQIATVLGLSRMSVWRALKDGVHQ
jgi:hypothetical protein